MLKNITELETEIRTMSFEETWEMFNSYQDEVPSRVMDEILYTTVLLRDNRKIIVSLYDILEEKYQVRPKSYIVLIRGASLGRDTINKIKDAKTYLMKKWLIKNACSKGFEWAKARGSKNES